jgi:peptidoglycan hydrolase CwlO-like protein
MSNFIKKIPISIVVLISTLIISWTTWVTAQSYNSQNTKKIVEDHITKVENQQTSIHDKLEKIELQISEDNKKLCEKISQNNKEMYNLLLDIQKQIGDKNGKN